CPSGWAPPVPGAETFSLCFPLQTAELEVAVRHATDELDVESTLQRHRDEARPRASGHGDPVTPAQPGQALRSASTGLALEGNLSLGQRLRSQDLLHRGAVDPPIVPSQPLDGGPPVPAPNGGRSGEVLFVDEQPHALGRWLATDRCLVGLGLPYRRT